MIHVALVAPYPLPGKLARGGVERVTEVLRVGLARHARVSVLVPNAPEDLTFRDEHGPIRYLKRAPIPGVLSYCTLMSKAVLAEIAGLAPDIVHVQDMGGVATLWPAATPRPRVFTIHGILDEDIRQEPGSGLVRRATRELRARFMAAVERRARALFDDVVVINPYVLEAMPDLASRRTHAIPNPVDPVFLGEGQARREPADGAMRLLQAGLVSPRKNVAGSIAILAELRRLGTMARLDVVGPIADPAYKQHCDALVASLDLGEHVTFHGGVSPAGMAGWMDRSDALLLVSGQETAPIVVAEAHCRGLPVAVRPAFGFRHMVRAGVDGCFLPGESASADARAVASMASVPWDRDAIRAAARQAYDPDTLVRRTLALYETALARSGAGATRPLDLEIA